MYNARNILAGIMVAGLLAGAMSCSGDSARTEAATAVLTDAQRLVEANKYDSALTVLDTLDHKYRDCLEQRRQGTLVRIAALSAMTSDSLAMAKLDYAAAEEAITRLSPSFKEVKLEGTDGYWVDKSVYSGSEMNKNSVQLRVDDKGYMFMVVNLSGRRIGLDAVIFGDIKASGKSIDVEGSEIMSLHQEAVKPLIEALTSAAAEGAKTAVVTLAGAKGSVKVTLDSRQLASIVATNEYAGALQKRQQTAVRLEKLERRMAKLNDQLANMTPEPVDE
ncbi:MAG: hypothetical protein K2M19_00330 [Muribaculaceae bacterium]|nr:hypothetical protein [Muribaculaceae bacterium]